MVSEQIECEICGKRFKSTQGLAGHVQLKHGSSAQVKPRGRGGIVSNQLAELSQIANWRYQMLVNRVLALELARMEKEFYQAQQGAQPSAQATAQRSNIIVLPLPPQEPEKLCPVCGKAISEHYEPRERAMQSRREGVKSGYVCPHCNAVLYPSTF